MPKEQIANMQYRRWSERRDQASTITLCCALAETGEARPGALDPALMFEVGHAAERLFPDDAGVLQAVGRMYLAGAELDRALTALTRSAGIAGRARTFRLLGEALLRLGDAQVAAPMFSRAIKAGEDDPETLGWHATAKAYMALQETEGPAAVACEVRAALDGRDSTHVPPASDKGDSERTMPFPGAPIEGLSFDDESAAASVPPLPRFPSVTDVSISEAHDAPADLTSDVDEPTDAMSSSGIVAAIQSAVDRAWEGRDRAAPAPPPEPPTLPIPRTTELDSADFDLDDEDGPAQVMATGPLPGLVPPPPPVQPIALGPITAPRAPSRILPVSFEDDTRELPRRRALPPLVPSRPPPSRRGPVLVVVVVALLLAAAFAAAIVTGLFS